MPESKRKQSTTVELKGLPGPMQAVWSEVYQLVHKNLKAEGVDPKVAKGRARSAAAEHINQILVDGLCHWYYDEEVQEWIKSPRVIYDGRL